MSYAPRVLLIDGSSQEATRLASQLPPDRFRASISGSLASAMAYLSSERTDVVVLDLDLPDSQGFDTLQRFREVAPELPLVVLTRSDRHEDHALFVRAGAHDCVGRGDLDGGRLLRVIELAIERQRLWATTLENRAREVLAREVQLQLKDQVLSQVSHELRAPLSAIQQFLGLLAEGFSGDLNAEQQRFVGAARASAAQLDRLVGDLLDTSRIALGRLPMRRRPTPLSSLLEGAVRAVQPAFVAKEQEVELASGDSLIVDVDPDRITQVLVNLLQNAARCTPEKGRIRASVEVKPGEAFARIAVEDSGPGVETGDRELIFQSLRQGPCGREANSGLGLGLYLAREIVALHGGEIGVSDSELGGARFHFTVPVAAASAAAGRGATDERGDRTARPRVGDGAPAESLEP